MDCERCTLDGRKVTIYIPEHFQYNCLFVGQAPGETEVITGMPFTGGAGKTQYRLMKEGGLYKSQFPFTNIVQCKPPSDSKGNDRTPTPTEIKCCIKHLYEEIWSLQPDLICALGGVAMKVLTGNEGIMSHRGSLSKLKEDFQYECDVLSLLHPSFVMKQRHWFPVAINDLRLIHDYFAGSLVNEVSEYDIPLDISASALREYLNTDKVIDVDIETTGLDPFEATILGLSFSRGPNEARPIYFSNGDDRLEVVKKYLQDPNRPKSMQNGSFDCKVIQQQWGIIPKGLVYDTRLAEQLLNSDMPKNLDHLRAVYTKVRPYKPTKAEMKVMDTWPKDKMMYYNGMDTITTHQVRLAQSKLLSSKEMWLQENLLTPLVEVINSMEIKGVKVDIDTLAGMYAQIIPKADKILKKITLIEPGFNPNSPKQLKELLGTSNAQKATLERMVQRGHERAEFLKLVLEYREYTKGAGTFLKGVFDRLKDGRIHTQYNIEGTGTGRLSSENPNLQNIPKDYRGVYIGDNEDSILISGDYSQLELWTIAVIGDCKVLYEALSNGTDIHGTVEQAIDDYLPLKLKDRRRLIAKLLVFGTIYGMGPTTIARDFKVTKEVAATWQNMLFGVYPGLKEYQEARKVDWSDRGYVTTPWGRKRYIQTVPQALNAPVQSSASDITLSSLNECYYNYNLDIRLQVHDEILIHTPLKDWEENARKLKEAMERPIKEMNGQSFPAHLKAGYDWYNMQEVEI